MQVSDTNVTLNPFPPNKGFCYFSKSIVHIPLVEGVDGRSEKSRIHDPLVGGVRGAPKKSKIHDPLVEIKNINYLYFNAFHDSTASIAK